MADYFDADSAVAREVALLVMECDFLLICTGAGDIIIIL
jgi:hypothetical protein